MVRSQPLEDSDYMEVVVFRSFSLKMFSLRLFFEKYSFYFSLELRNVKNTKIVLMNDSMRETTSCIVQKKSLNNKVFESE